MSGRRAKEQRRRAGSGFDAASPAPSRVHWTERLTVAGVLTGALIPFVPTSAFALPQGGTVAAGAATISTPTATSMRVDQTTDRAIVDWTRFNIAANESVRFQQPSAASIALNRVSGQEPSAIFGSLSANGQIFLLNPSGILFGSSSRVDVGALTASTLTMSNQDFLAGQYRFTQDATRANAAVVNQGLITAGPGGYVALLGAAARNEGVIQAQLGSIALAAGKAATLDMRGDGLIQFVITEAVSGSVTGPDGQPLASSVSNTGTLQADGGMVTLQAKAAAGLVRSVVNQEGIIRATSLVNRGGVITLVAEGAQAMVSNTGTLDVSAGELNATAGAITVHSDQAINLAGTVTAGAVVLSAPEIQSAADISAGAAAFTATDLTLTGGSVTAATGTINVAHGFTQTGGSFAPGAATITVGGNWTHAGGTFDPGTSTVVFHDAGQSSTILGDNTFYNFTSVTPDKKLFFEAGATQTVLGAFTIAGEKAHLIQLRSTDPGGAQWRLDPRGQVDVKFVHLGDAWNLSPTLIKALPSNSYGNNTGWDTDPVWNAVGAGNWSTDANWDTGVRPGAADTVTFDATSVTNSTVDAGFAGTIANLNINAGYTGTIDLARSLTINSAFTQAAGTFNGAASAMTVSGAFTLSGGTFTSTSGTLTVGGNWTHTAGGTFTHNSGTVVASGVDATWDVAVTETFNNLTVNRTAGGYTLTIASGDTLIVGGTFTHTDGYINTGTIEARGNVVIGASADGGTGTISFLVAGDQTITGSGGTTANLNINKPSDTVSGSGNFGITSFTLGGGTFTSTSGTLTDTGNWTHTAGGTFTHNSGTVVASGTNATWDVAVTETFNNLTVSKTGGGFAHTIASGDTLIVGGTFTHTDGVIDTGTIEARGNVVIGASADGGTGTISFLVAGDQTITGSGGTTANLNINKPSGTVSGSGDFGVPSFTLGGGTFTSTSGTLTDTGNWTHTAGGTFTHNSGTVVASGTNATWDVAVTETFNNLTVNKTGGGFTHTIASGDTLIVGGTFTHTDGLIHTGTIEARGNVVIGASADGGTGLLSFTGTANQTYTQSGNVVDGLVTINKASGTVTLASATTWNAASQNLTVTSGTLDLAGFALSTGTLTVAAAGTVQLQGAETITAATVTLNAGSTIRYYGTAAAYTLKNYAYSNLTIDGGAATVFTFPANLTSINTLTLNNSITSLAGFNLTATTLVNNATLRLQGNETVTITTMDIDSGLVQYVGDGVGGLTSFTIKDFGATDYYNLTINSTEGSAESFSLAAALTVVGAFTHSSGTLTAGASGINLTAGSATISAPVTATAGGNILLTTDTIDLAGAASTISGTGTLTLQPSTASTTIGLGGGAGTFNLTTTEIAALTNGFNGGITIGRADSSGAVTVSAVTFTDPVTIQSPAGAGTITVNGTITDTKPSTGSVTLTGGTGATPIVLAAGITTAKSAITLNDNTQLNANVTLDTTGSGFGVGNNITIAGTINADLAASNRTLTLNGGSSGTVSVTGAVGGSQALQTFTVTSANSASLPAITTQNGGISVTATTITLNGNLSTDSIANAGAVALTGAVTLGSGVTIDTDAPATDGNITFSSTINGAQALTLTTGTGNVVVSGIAGGTTRLTSLTASGKNITVQAVSTTGAQSYTSALPAGLNGNLNSNTAGAITVTGGAALATGAIVVQTAGLAVTDDITFTGTIDGGQPLTLTAGAGDVLVTGTVGGTWRPTSLTASGTTVNVRAVSTTGAQSYTGITTLNGNLNSNTSGAITVTGAATLATGAIVVQTAGSAVTNDITFTSTINGGQALTLTAGLGDVLVSGIAGGGTRLTSLTASGTTIGLQAVSTTGAQSYTGITTLNGNLDSNTAGAITVTGTATLATGAIAVQTAGGAASDNITFTSTIDGGQALTLTAGVGDVTVSGTIGASTALSAITITGNDITLANIGGGAAGVTGATAVTATTAGGDTGSITFTGTTYNANAQTYTAPAGQNFLLNAGAATTFTSTDDAITFGTGTLLLANGSFLTVTSAGGAISMSGGIRGTSSEDVTLTSSGGTTNTVSVGQIGNADEINTVTLTGSSDVTLTGNIITSNAAGNNVLITGPTTLGADITITTNTAGTDGFIRFIGTINADAAANNRTLTLNAGSGASFIDLQQTVGGTQALQTFTVTSSAGTTLPTMTTRDGGINVTSTIIDLDGNLSTNSIATAGPLALTGSVVLTGAAGHTLTTDAATTDANITITGTTAADAAANNRSLTLTAGTGNITFTQTIGGGNAIQTLTVTSAANATLPTITTRNSGISVTATNITLGGNLNTISTGTAGPVALTGAVTLGANVTINTNGTNAADANITFSSTINGAQTLTLDAGQKDVTVGGTIGGSTALTALTITGNDITLANIGGGAAGVSGATTVTGTTAGADIGSITFTGTTYNANAQTYTAPAGQTILVNGGAATTFTSTDDAITFATGTLLLANGSDLTVTTAGGDIAIAGGIRGTSSEDVTLTSSGGTTNTVSVGQIGSADEINTVALTGSTSVTLSGDITTSNAAGNTVTITGPASLGAAVIITTNTAGTDGNISFSSTVNSAQNLTLTAGGGDISIGGALNLTSGTLTPTGNSVTVTGLATVSGGTYIAGSTAHTFNGGLTVSSGTFTGAAGTVTVVGAFNESNGIFTAPSGTMNVSGNFTHSGGTFTHNSGTVVLNGTNQTLSGATTFNNLTKTVASAATLTFPSGASNTQTVAGTLTLQGASGQLLTLASDVPGTQWQIDPQGTRTIGYLSVSDSYNINSARINAIGTNSVNGGNNSGWSFIAPPNFTWIGDGADVNWLTAANWQGGVAPGAANTAIFDGNSSKNATVNAGFAGTIGNLNINAGYTGTIDLARSLTINTAFSQAAGTFNGAASAMTVSGGFTLSGGTFTSTTGTLTVNGNWTHTAGGTFAHNGGTVMAGGATNTTWDVNGTETFNNLTVNKTGGSGIVIASGDTLIVGGTFTYTAGAINTGTIQAQGAVVVAAGATGGTGTVQVTSAGAQTIEGNGGILPILRVSKASGTLSLGTTNVTVGALTIDAANTLSSTSGTLTVTGDWTNTAGGTFTHNAGTVVNSGGINSSWDVAGTETFNNLTVNKTGGSGITIAAGDTLIVGGTFTYTAGAINTGTIQAQGAVVVAAGATGGTGMVQVTSAGAQTIEGNGGALPSLRVSKPSGTLSLGTTNITVNNLTIDAANTLSGTTGTLTVLGNWTNTAGGTFTHNAGTVVASGGTNSSWDVAGTETFNNLTVNKPGANLNIAAGDTFIVGGTFTHTDGLINTGTIQAQGNVTISAGASGGTAKLTFAGTADQTYTQSGNVVDGLVTLNKASGTVTLATAATWNAASQNLTVTSGTLDLAGFALSTGTLTVAAAGTVQLQGAETITAGSVTLNAGSTIRYYGTAAAYTLKNYAYSNLTIDGGAATVFSFPANLTSINTLTLNNSITSLVGFNLTATTLVNNATLRLQGNETVTLAANDIDSGTWEYVGDGAGGLNSFTIKDFGATDYYNLRIAGVSGSETFTVSSALKLNGALTHSTGTLSLGANVTTAGGTITSTDVVTLGANTIVDTTDAGGSPAGANMTFTSTINGAQALTLTAGAGDVLASGTIGGTTRLSSLTASGNTVNVQAVSTTGAQSYTGTTTLNGNLNSNTAGAITVTGAATVATGAITVQTAGLAVTDDITFTSTINGGQALTLTAGAGDVLVSGIAGGSTRLSSVTASGNTINIQAVSTTGAQSYTGITTLNGNLNSNTAGAITVTGAATLATGAIVVQTAGLAVTDDITFTSTINGAQALTLTAGDADVIVSGTIGGTTALSALTITGNDITLANIGGGAAGVSGATTVTAITVGADDASITFTGTTYNANAQTYTGPALTPFNLTAGAPTTFTSSDDAITFATAFILSANGSDLIITSGGGPVTTGAIYGTSSEDVTITSSGGTTNTVTVGTIGNGNMINTVAITAPGGIRLNGNIVTSNSAGNTVTLTGPVTLGANVVISTDTAVSDGNITLTSTLDAISAGAQNIILNVGDADVSIGGTIGGTTALSALTIMGNDITLANIGGGSAGVTGATSVTATTAGADTGSITFTGTTYNANAQTYTAPAGQTILVNGGAATTFTSTNDAITFATGTLLLANGSDLTVNSAGGAIAIAGGIRGTSSEDVTLTSSGGATNTVSVGQIGSGDEINTVALTGSTSVTLSGDITTSNAAGNTVSITGPTSLGAAVIITTDTAGTDGNISFSSTINGAQALTLTAGAGDVLVSGIVGGSTRLSSVTASGNTVAVQAVSTTGAQSYTGITTLNGNLNSNTAGAITVTGAAMLATGAITVQTAGLLVTDDITFTSTINGGQALTLTAGAGDVLVSGIAGGGTRLSSITASGNTVNVQAVNTTGAQSYTGVTTLNGNLNSNTAGAITVTGAATLATGAITVQTAGLLASDDITFTSTINGAQVLTLTAGLGDVLLSGSIGGSTPLQTLTITSATTASLPAITTRNGGISVTAGTITLNGDLVTTSTATAGPVTLTGDVLAPGSVILNTDGTGTDADITITGTVNAPGAMTLTADTGNVTVTGLVGNVTPLTSFTVTSATTASVQSITTGSGGISLTATNIVLGGNLDSTATVNAGNVMLAGVVRLAGDTLITTDAAATDGTITTTGAINATVAGTQGLTLNSGTSGITLDGIGTTTALKDLTVTTSGLTTLNANIRTDNNVGTGNVTFSGATGGIRLGADITINSDAASSGTGGAVDLSGSAMNATGAGAQALTISAPGNAVTLAAVGATTRLSTLTATGSTISLQAVSTTGAQSYTGATTLNGNLNSNTAGAITVTGAATLATGPITVQTAGLLATDDITFTSTVDGAQTLTLTAGAGDVLVSGIAGGATRLSSVTASGNTINVQAVSTTGAQSYTGAATLNGNLNSNTAGSILVTGAATLASGPITVQTAGLLASDDITFTSTINGAQVLTLSAGLGDVLLSGSVGGTTPLQTLTITSATTASLPAITTRDGGIAVTAGTITLNGDLVTTSTATAGPVTLTGDVLAPGSVLLNTNGSGTDADITITGTVNAPGAMTLTADTGNVTVTGFVGNVTPVTSFTVTSATTASVQSITTGSGGISLTATNIVLGGNLDTTATVNAGNVVLAGVARLAGDTVIDTDAATTDGTITTTGAINATVAGTQGLTLNSGTSGITLDGIGTTTALKDLTVTTSGLTTLNANIRTDNTVGTGNVTFSGATGGIRLGADIAMTSDAASSGTGGAVNLSGSAINATGAGAQGLTISAPGNAVTLAAVGPTTRLSTLTATGSTIGLQAVSTTGAQSYTGTTTLNGNLNSNTAGAITITGAATLATGAIAVQTAGLLASDDITFSSTINGGQALTLTAGAGDVLVSGIAGGGTRLSSITASGNTINVQAVNTTGAQSYTGITTLNGNLNSNTAGAITVTGAATLATGAIVVQTAGLLASDDITFTSTINGGQALTLTAGAGDVLVSGIAGGATRLSSVTASGNTIGVQAVSTTGAQSYTGATTLNGNLNSNTAGAITVTGMANLATGAIVVQTAGLLVSDDITFTSTINGAQVFTLTAGAGDVLLSGSIGGTTPLQTFTITSATTASLPAITTRNGGIAVTAGTITLNGDLVTTSTATAGPVTLTGNVLAPGSVILNTDGTGTDADITITGTVNAPGAMTLTADTGNVTVTGLVGNVTPLTSFTVTSATTASVQSITTGSGGISLTATNIVLGGNLATTATVNAGNVVLAGVVRLAGDTLITTDAAATDGTITTTGAINATVAGTQGLTLNSGTSGITLDGIGTTTALKDLTVTTSGLTTLNANIRTDNNVGTGNVTFSGATGGIRLGADITINSDAASSGTGGAVDLSGSAMNATGAGAQALTISAPGNAITLAAVGATTRLSTLTATGSTISLQAVSTTGAQSYTGATTLNGNLNSNTAGAITVTGAATLATGAITVQTAGFLATDDITFTSTVDGAQALTLTAGAGDVLMSGIVGGSAPLSSLTASGNTIGVQAVSTTGAQSYTGTTTLSGDLTTTNSAITLNSPTSMTTQISITAGTGTVTAASSLSSAGNALTITADEIDFTGGANSVTGTSSLLLRPSTPGLDITLGGPGGTAALDLTAAEVNALGNGFSGVTIGRTADGTGTVTISPVTLSAPLTVVGGTLTVGGLTDTGQSVTLTARTADIQGSGGGPHVTAGTLTLNAVTGIGSVTPLLTSGVTSLTAATTGAGAASITLANTGAAALTVTSASTGGAGANLTLAQSGGGALTITSATTTDGAISLSNAGGNLTATSVAAGGAGRNVTLTTTGSGNISLGSVSALGDTITVTSAGDMQGSGAGPHLVGDTLVLSAVNGIGNTTQVLSSGAITISATTTGAGAASIDLANTSAALTTIAGATTAGTGANITLAQSGAGGLTVTTASTTDGAITLTTANGALTIPSLTAGGTGRNIIVTASAGNVLIGAATASGDTVTLTAAGAMTDTNAAANNITASNLVASAGTGIASVGDPLETTISNLEATGGTGGVFIANTGALTIGGIGAMVGVSATASDIRISAASPMTVTEAVTTDGAGTITLTTGATGANDDLTINAALTAAAGTITLTSGDGVLLGANVTTSGNVLITAGTAITRSAGTVLGNGVLLDAATGIGFAGSPVQTAATTLAARTTVSGGIFVTEADGLVIGTVSGVNGLTTSTGAITVSTNGDLIVNQGISAGGVGAVILTASGGSLTGVGGVSAGGDLTISGASVGSTSTPFMFGTIGGTLNGTVDGGAPTDAFNVQAFAASTINLGVITAIGPVIGIPVTIDATGGSIRHVHPGTDITGGRVNFWAATIGTLGFDLEVITDNPPVMCNGVACDLPYFVNGATATYNALLLRNGLSQSGRYLLGVLPEEGTLLTAGVLPDYIYACLDSDRRPVVCTAGAMWHDDDGTTGVLQAESGPADAPTQAVAKASARAISPARPGSAKTEPAARR